MIRLFRSPSTRRTLLVVLLAIVALLLAAAIASGDAPQIGTVFAGATIDISADKAWLILPGDCTEISWQLEGIMSLYIDGEGKIGWGELKYCPSLGSASPEFRITAQSGDVRAFSLEIYFLPTELLNCLFFVLSLGLLVVALWYVAEFRLDEPPPLQPYMALALAAVWLAFLLATALDIFSIRQILAWLRDLFHSTGWQYLGVFLSLLVFIPLVLQSVQRGSERLARADLPAVAGFFVFLLLLYLPFGFDSIAELEGLANKASLEGMQSGLPSLGELTTRYWIFVPYALAHIVSPDAFTGNHLLNFALFWGQMVLLYGLLRGFSVPRTFAFLFALLYMAYPVNTHRLSLQNLNINFNTFTIYAALFLAVNFRPSHGRLRLIGIWLAMLLTLGSDDVGYVLIAVAPLIWWWRRRSKTWQNINLSVIWYLPAALKFFYVILLVVTSQSFRGSTLAHGNNTALLSGRPWTDILSHYTGILAEVYAQSFVTGWREAVSAISQNSWFIPTAAMLLLAGILGLWLARREDSVFPTNRQAAVGLLIGLLSIAPSVGVLIWLEKYNRSLWRMYGFVPIGAALAVLSLVVLVSSLANNKRVRQSQSYLLSCFCCFQRSRDCLCKWRTIGKGRIIRLMSCARLAEQAPQLAPETEFILLTSMGLKELGDNQIYAFRRIALEAGMWLLYEDNRPSLSILCWKRATVQQ